MLSTLFGINGVGKDTLAKQITERKSCTFNFVSNSRIMMYLLHITDFYDIWNEVKDYHYQQLSNLDAKYVRHVELTDYPLFIERLAQSEKRYVMLSHLVVAQYYSNKLSYLTEEKIPDWFVKMNDWLIELIAPAQIILQRRVQDISKRKRPTSLSQINEHQRFCDLEWQRLLTSDVQPQKGMKVIVNTDLTQASAELLETLLS